MNIDAVAIDVVNLPKNFSSRGNISIVSLLKESGYFDIHEAVTENAIHDALRKHPKLVSDWLNYSEDKRSSSGWFLRRAEVGHGYELGRFPEQLSIFYSDEFSACAAFIKREVDDIRANSYRR